MRSTGGGGNPSGRTVLPAVCLCQLPCLFLHIRLAPKPSATCMHKKKKATSTGESVCKYGCPQGSHLQNMQTALSAQFKESKQPNRQGGQRPAWKLLPGRPPDRHKAREDWLSITITGKTQFRTGPRYQLIPLKTAITPKICKDSVLLGPDVNGWVQRRTTVWRALKPALVQSPRDPASPLLA